MTTVTPTLATPTPATTTPTSTTGTSGSGTSANSATGNSALDFSQNFNTFLTLLTTQLQNQDPLSPMDSNQFTSELAQFAGVEQQIKTNSLLTQQIAGQAGSEAVSALPLVGQTIQYNGDQAVLENGQAGFSYTLPSGATQATLNINDSSGNTVFTESISPNAGTQNFIWNGQTTSGQQEPDGGVYTISINATGANNAQLTATTTAVGTVSGVSVSNNVATFTIDGTSLQVPMNQLVSVLGSSSGNSSSTASN